MGRFEKGNSGRPRGARNKQGNRANLVKLLDYIIKDFEDNYHKLTTSQKIKLLSSFKGIYEDTNLTDEDKDHFRAVTVNIISNRDEERND